MILTKNEKQLVENKIRDLQDKTTGAVIPIFLKKAHFYPLAHYKMGLILMVLALALLYYVPLYYPPLAPLHNPQWFILFTLGPFIVGYLLAFIPKLKRLLTSNREMQECFYQKGIQIFFEQNIHTSKERDSVLVIISLFEKRIQILADTGVNALVSPSSWNQAVSQFSREVQESDLISATLKTLDKIGEVLIDYLPKKSPYSPPQSVEAIDSLPESTTTEQREEKEGEDLPPKSSNDQDLGEASSDKGQ